MIKLQLELEYGKKFMSINGYVNFENQKCAFDLDDFRIKIFNDKNFNIFSEKTDVPDYLYGVTDTNYEILFKTTGEARNIARYTQLFIPVYLLQKQILYIMI